MKLYLAAGHGLRPNGTYDPGAPSQLIRTGAPPSPIYEHDYNVAVVTYALDEAKMYPDLNIVTDLNGSTGGKAHDPNWVGSVHSLTKYPFDLAVEVHHDFILAPKGGFGIVPKRDAITVHQLMDLAHLIESAYHALGLPTRPSYVDTRGLGFLKAKTKTLIWECSRMERKEDIYPTDTSVLRVRAQGLIRGIAQHYGLPRKV